MPKIKDPLRRAEMILKSRKAKGIKKTEIEDWQQRWRSAGPIVFGEELLTCPLDVPIHPDYDPDNNPMVNHLKCEFYRKGDCPIGDEHPKFRDNGIPFHIIYSEDQTTFLTELWNGVVLALVSAARGAGKTFCLGIWDTWQITTQDRYSITCMGGSSEQSELIQDYIDNWRLDINIIMRIIHRSLRGIKKVCHTIGRSKCKFPACSTLASRGPHVNEVQIDEACAAEDKSEDGAKAVKSAMWQLTGKRVGRLIMTSTAHYIHGTFYEYMKDPKKYGFKLYQWAIAKHISGETDPLKVYTDKDPTHWLPNVWWLTDDEVQKQRRTKSDEEWLCEALGGASMASGAALKKDDLDVIICDMCDNCEPYIWDKCKLCKLAQTGTPEDPTKFIIDRNVGFDYGVSVAPCALSIVGRKSNLVFVLWNDEQLGLKESEKIKWILDAMKLYKTNTFIPDPAVAGKHINEDISNAGYAVYMLAEQEKLSRVFNVINFVEKHKIIVPKAFWYLTQSLRKLAWKKEGLKLRKIDDHSFDTLQYAMVDYQVEEGGGILEEFLKRAKKNIKRGGKGMPTSDEVFSPQEKPKKKGSRLFPRYEDIYSD